MYFSARTTLGSLVQAVLNTRRVPGYVDRHYLVFEPGGGSVRDHARLD